MIKNLAAAERLIVAADFKPDPSKGQGVEWAYDKLLDLADELHGLGVVIKVNSILRAVGYEAITKIQHRNLKVFPDLKLDDISETMSIDGKFLRNYSPYMVTAKCSAGAKGLRAIKAELPDTEVLGVTVLTTFDDEECAEVYDAGVTETALRLAKIAVQAGLDGLISSPAELELFRGIIDDNLSRNAPGVRFAGATVRGDDQNPDRVMTPAKAIRMGADRIVMGRPITQAENPRDAVMRAIDEIASAL